MDRRYFALLWVVFMESAQAEVSDKIAAVPDLWAVGVVCALVVGGLTLWKPAFICLAALVTALGVSATVDLASAPDLASAILREQGHWYFAHSYASAVLPLAVASLAFGFARKK